MSVCWTEDQRKVIDIRGRNLLVSAAAGSGKTAVLVERILQLITDPEHPVDVDRLLITTFTKAAAAEMKERISKALAERLRQEPGNEWLQRQEALVPRAQITTIHGFCLYVIRNYFHTIDLNPNFRIADEGEMRLLKQDTVEEILEEAFQEKSTEFIKFAESYGSGNRGGGLDELILRLYEYAVASPMPKRWLQESAARYRMPEHASWSDFAGAPEILESLRIVIGDCLHQIQEARRMTSLPGGPTAYDDALKSDELFLKSLMDCDSIENFEDRILQVSWARLPSKRAKVMQGADAEICEQIAAVRNDVKEAVKSLSAQYFSLPGELVMEQMRCTAENVQTYVDLTLRFMERLEEKKRKKNMLDFTDQEHLALRILTREKDGELVPSEVAEVFAGYFAEIMVDEYQDSNLVQEAILQSISGCRNGRDNCFMVGDVKQSIYRFRQAEPGLFLDKYDRYEAGKEGVRIDLHQNFRSRGSVLRSVNDVFRRIMRKELGGIEYDDKAELKAGAVYPENENDNAELLVLVQEEWNAVHGECGWTKQEAEAHLIAGRIRQMLRSEKITDRGCLRAVRPGDIVILLRTMSGWSETFVRVLQEEGIPASAQSRVGYFQTLEVETLLSYLKVLDNPSQEIPLAAAMHGMLGKFTSEEMAQIKAEIPTLGYASACVQYAEHGRDDALRQKVQHFIEQMQDYRRRAVYTSIHELLWQIVAETGYLDEVRALPGGEQRLANVEMLLQKAQDYEQISFHGLFHFVRYIEKMQKFQMDYGEADISGAGGDAVQIMSIHHSKGLEFPVVICAGMGKSFNKQESRDKAVFHNRYGIGLDYVDLEQRMRRATILKQFIRRQNLLDNLGEELRILYVAMTRAKEKLILTGMTKGDDLKLIGRNTDARFTYLQLMDGGSYLDWVLPTLAESGGSIQCQIVSLENLIRQAVQMQMQTMLGKEELEQKVWLGVGKAELVEKVNENLSWNYPWNTDHKTKQKYSVTELKKLRMQEESDLAEEIYKESDMVPLIPQFVEKTEEKTGAARGTVYHTVMEWLDYKGVHTLSQMQDRLQSLKEQDKLSEEDLRAVNAEDFLVFAGTDLAKRMQHAKERGELYREQPFVIGLPGTEVDGEDADEMVLIQGIIDAFFYEDDEIVVLDYKTDRVQCAAELVEKYHAQLEYYEQALEMMTGKNVKERLIYSFRLGEVINV